MFQTNKCTYFNKINILRKLILEESGTGIFIMIFNMMLDLKQHFATKIAPISIPINNDDKINYIDRIHPSCLPYQTF
jgi:hypothetical protein